MKRVMMMMVVVAVAGFTAMPVHAEEDAVAPEKAKKEKKVKAPKVKKVKAPKVKKEKKVKPPKPVPAEMTISGVISKEEKKGKGDKVTVKYVLTDTEGNKIRLPAPKKPKKGDEAAQVIKLADYVDAAVTITGTGTKAKKKDKEVITLKTLTKVEKPAGVADIKVFPEADE